MGLLAGIVAKETSTDRVAFFCCFSGLQPLVTFSLYCIIIEICFEFIRQMGIAEYLAILLFSRA